MNRKEIFSIRKLAFGAASVMIGCGIYGVSTLDVHAEETETMVEESTTEVETTEAEEATETVSTGIVKEEESSIATYNFYDENDSVISSQLIKKGDTLVSPSNPEKSGSTFLGWSDTKNGTVVLSPFSSIVISEEQVRNSTINYFPIFQEQLVVSFVTPDGVVVTTKEGNSGEVITTSDVTYDVDLESKVTGWYTDRNYNTKVDEVTLNGSNVTLYAKVEQGHFITFVRDASATYVEPEFVAYGEVSIEPTAPTRNGYSFLGWSTTQNSSVADYVFGQELSSNVTLYAVWQAEQTTYIVRVWQQYVYDDKNASDENKQYVFYSSSVGTALTGSTVNSTDLETSLSFEGMYRNTNKETTVTVNGDGTSIVDIFFDRDLITVEYFYFTDDEDGEQYGGIGAAYSTTNLNNLKLLTKGEDGNWYLDGNIYTSQRYKMIAASGLRGSTPESNGYNLTMSDSTHQVFLGSISTEFARFFTIAPNHTKSNSFRARECIPNPPYKAEIQKYEQLDGSFIDKASMKANKGVNISKNGVEGYTALYYQYDDGEIIEITSWPMYLTYSETSTLILYRMLNTYELTYFNNGEIAKTESIKYTAPLSEYASYVPEQPSNLPSNYIFMGWYLDESLTVEADFSGTMPSNSLSVYAKWAAPTYTVTVHHTMDVDSDSTSFEQEYLSAIDTAKLYDIVESGQWATYSNGVYTIYSLSSLIDGDIELYPYSVDMTSYSVVYDLDGGTGNVVDSLSYTSNTGAVVLGSGGATKSGRPFLYWTVDGDIYYPGMILNMDGDVRLVAVYGEKEPVANLAYDPNGGLGNVYYIGNVQNNGTLVVLSASELGMYRPGYTFIGWMTSDGRMFYVGDVIRIDDTEGNILYAVWQKNDEGKVVTEQISNEVVVHNGVETSLSTNSSLLVSTMIISGVGTVLFSKKRKD